MDYDIIENTIIGYPSPSHPYHIYDIIYDDMNHDRMYDIIDQAYDIIVHASDLAYSINNDMHCDMP